MCKSEIKILNNTPSPMYLTVLAPETLREEDLLVIATDWLKDHMPRMIIISSPSWGVFCYDYRDYHSGRCFTCLQVFDKLFSGFCEECYCTLTRRAEDGENRDF